MITDIAAYLRFFDSVRRRTERDVAALPPAAAAWRPPAAGGGAGWGIGQIVAHIGASRLYFAGAYRGEGWIWGEAGADPGTSGRGCRGSSGRRSGSPPCCARPRRRGSPAAWR
jgi:hypothetical protein